MIITIIAVIFVFGMVILFHELGHFLIARRVGVQVEVFSLGMGPKLVSFKRGETEYRVCAIPFGGYIKMAGEDGEEQKKEKWHFSAKSPAQRAGIIVSGPLGSFVLGFLAFSLVFMLGIPIYTYSIAVMEVQKDSPAWKTGLQVGDEILAVNDKEIKHPTVLTEAINESMGEKVKLLISRKDEEIVKYAIPEFDEELKKGRIGVVITTKGERKGVEKFGFFPSLGKGALEMLKFIQLTYIIIWKLLTGCLSARNLLGPLGIAQMTGEIVKTEITSFLYFIALISVNLGVVNLLPIPVLDGGHLMFLGIEKIKGNPLSEKKREIFQNIGFGLLVILLVFVTFNDFKRWVEQKRFGKEGINKTYAPAQK